VTEDNARGELGVLDADQQTFDYGHGGVPWLLLLFYLSFLVFFVWYVFEYQIPDFLQQPEATAELVEGATPK
jgi:hypothetical protein